MPLNSSDKTADFTACSETEDPILQRAYLIKAGQLLYPALFGTDALSLIDELADGTISKYYRWCGMQQACPCTPMYCSATIQTLNKLLDTLPVAASFDILHELLRNARKVQINDLCANIDTSAAQSLGCDARSGPPVPSGARSCTAGLLGANHIIFC